MMGLSQTYLIQMYFVWSVQFTHGWNNIPRLVLKQDRINSRRLEYPIFQNHTVFFQPEGSDLIYVGGTDIVYQIDVEENCVLETFQLKTTGQHTCDKGLCKNVITVIQKFQDSLFVCGTNGNKPQCWKLYPKINNQSSETVESYEGTGIAPHFYLHNSLSLTVEGDLYAAAPLDRDGNSLQFRRKAGSRTNVWMNDKWVSEPTFIAASWVKREDTPDKEKIYIFFREKNSDTSPEADPWISRVAQVCKVDEGGSKRFFQNMWTSFLKARLVCGIPKESLYFNRLQDIYVLHAESWRETKVYALFSSSWNSTAVCIYSMDDIDNIFEFSNFKGFDQEIPNPRPGSCVPNSRNLPLATLNVVKDHPEMSDWIHPIHPQSPFYKSSNNYTKIAVDRVQAADTHFYNVLFLSTESGLIHKVLEDGSEPFIISEIQLSNQPAVIRSMKLDSQKKRLLVGLSEQIFSLDIERCDYYNGSCAECVLARDPYCSWSQNRCLAKSSQGIQSIIGGKTNVCLDVVKAPEQSQFHRTKREIRPTSTFPEATRTFHSVPLDVPFYLSCPIESYHAVYTWEHEGQSWPCLQMQSRCLHLIPTMALSNYGDYQCVSKERDYTKVVKAYHLNQNRHSKRSSNIFDNMESSAEELIPQIGWLMSFAAVWLLR